MNGQTAVLKSVKRWNIYPIFSLHFISYVHPRRMVRMRIHGIYIIIMECPLSSHGLILSIIAARFRLIASPALRQGAGHSYTWSGSEDMTQSNHTTFGSKYKRHCILMDGRHLTRHPLFGKMHIITMTIIIMDTVIMSVNHTPKCTFIILKIQEIRWRSRCSTFQWKYPSEKWDGSFGCILREGIPLLPLWFS